MMCRTRSFSTVLCALLGLALAGCPGEGGGGPAATADRVGTEHPPVPDGVEKRAGTVVTRPGQDAADSRLGLSYVVVDGDHRIWLSELLRREPDGQPVWRVADVLEVGAVGPEERVMIHGCRSPDREWGIVAVMAGAGRETLTDARRAWRVVADGPRLEPIASEGVRCTQPGVGTP